MSKRRIAALVTKGIESLRRGHHTSAIFAFRHALACLKRNFESHAGAAEATLAIDPWKILPSSHVPLPLTETGDLQLSMHNTFDIYAFAFVFSPHESDLREFYNEITMGLFYNLGLAHHLAGLSNAAESQDHLKEALSFYKFSLALFQSQDDPRFETWFSFSLGLINNMGHIFCHFCMAEQVRACSDQMDMLLEAYDTPFLTEEEEGFFATSLHCSRCFTLAPSA